MNVENNKVSLKDKGFVFYCSLAVMLLTLLGLVMYLITVAETKDTIRISIVVATVIGEAIVLFSLLKCRLDGLPGIIAAALFMFSMGMYISTQAGNIGYAFAGITDIGYGILPSFIIGIALYIAGIVGECITIFQKTE